ncbi:Lar family restriction alleviation protein [Burkholderia gladioli]|uniref:Lar family restriction alleviation protein n=1 Tax=Burkholderia gladioli TaxID=28095 RepID=UPI003D369F90
MSDKLSELLACPFCGGRASSSQQTTGGRWAAYCLDCEAMVDGEFSEPDAISAWNRRASPAPAISESDLLALLPGTTYMDEPDRGSPPLLEQLQRMAKDAARYRWLQRQRANVWHEIADMPINRTNEHIDAARKGEKS